MVACLNDIKFCLIYYVVLPFIQERMYNLLEAAHLLPNVNVIHQLVYLIEILLATALAIRAFKYILWIYIASENSWQRLRPILRNGCSNMSCIIVRV